MPNVRLGNGRRLGAATVETAFALPICLLLVFGILEYSRYFMLRNLLTNAVREGARLATVNTNALTTTDIQNTVRGCLGGQQVQLQNFQVKVYSTDSSGNEIVGSDWKNTPFAAGIGVQADGDYQPILPNLLLMPAQIHLTAVAVMNSEGN